MSPAESDMHKPCCIKQRVHASGTELAWSAQFDLEFGSATMNASELGVAAPSLPAYLLFPVAALSAVLILWAMARARHRAGAFVIGSSWLRYVMQAFHT